MTFSKIACGLGLLALGLLALSGPLHRLGVPLAAAFGVLRWAGYIGVAAAVLGAAATAYYARKGARWAAGIAAVGLVAGLVALAVPSVWHLRERRYPPIHDVSTDLENPPAFLAVLPARTGAPNSLMRDAALAEQQRRGYPNLGPLTLPVPVEVAYARAMTVVQARGWELVAADQRAGVIEATATTFWFGFEDDVIVRLTPWGSGTRVDVRSASRVGEHDAGANAARIESFLAALERG